MIPLLAEKEIGTELPECIRRRLTAETALASTLESQSPLLFASVSLSVKWTTDAR